MKGQLTLVVPSMAYGDEIEAYRAEFLQPGAGNMNGSGSLQTLSVPEWLSLLKRDGHPDTCRDVPRSQFLCLRPGDGRMVGMVNIRHQLDEGMLHSGGHIGYSIRPSERNKGYGRQQLVLALDKCRDLGIRRALVCCDSDNEASRRIILSCGGVMEDIRARSGGKPVMRFWIALQGPPSQQGDGEDKGNKLSPGQAGS